MKHRLFFAVGTSALLLAALVPGGALAKAPATATRGTADLKRIDPGFKPAALDLKKQVKVIVKLAGDPVAVAQGAALDASPARPLSRAARADLRATLASRQDRLKPAIAALGGKVLAQYQDAFNGMTVRIARGRIAALGRLTGVVKVQAVRTYTAANTNTVPFIGADRAWTAGNGYAGFAGYTGAGIKIASIDTGIDYYHADFGGSGDPDDFACDDGTDRTGGGNCAIAGGGATFPTAKVVEGYDFVGDCYNASEDPGDPSAPTAECPTGFSDIPQPDTDPLDCNGHGTHTAGTAAGFGVEDGTPDQTYTGPYNTSTLTSTPFVIGPGVAPQALILAYRVFGCEGSADSSVIVDAIDRAVQDDADVISMSLGSTFGRDTEIDSEASNNASLAGVSVVASAGNSGQSAYISGSPAAASRAISVAALDGVPAFPMATIDFQTQPDEPAINANGGPLPVTGTIRVFQDDPATACTGTGEGCEQFGCFAQDYAFNSDFVAGDIPVVFRGVCARIQRAQVGDAQGASAVIMVNNSAGLPPFEGRIPGVDIPFLGVSNTATPKFMAEDDQQVTITDAGTQPNPTYRFIASFSSAGPRNGDSAVKPDVIAPGVSVYSALAGGGTDGEYLSGTSMSAPAVAGVAALVREAHSGWRPTRVKGAIVGTANPNLLATGQYDVRRAGAGVVQARRAVDTTAVFTTQAGNTNLDFGYQQLGGASSISRKLTLWNLGSTSRTYDLSTQFNRTPRGFTMTISPSTVTIAAHDKAQITVRLNITRANAAAFPGSEVSSALVYTPLNVVRGSVIADPTTGGPGAYSIRSPFLIAPRALAGVQPGQKSPYATDPTTATASITVSNSGVHAGDADVYAWGLSDRAEGFEENDLRAVGVQSFVCNQAQGCPVDGDRYMVFAINTWGHWSNQSTNEFDIPIDTKTCDQLPPPGPTEPVCEDLDPEYFLVAADFGAVVNGSFDGTMAAFLFDAAGDFVSFEGFLREFPNGSTIEVPVVASDLGLGPQPAAGIAEDHDFNYTVQAYSLIPGFTVDEINPSDTTSVVFAGFDPYDPALSQGDFESLAPGETKTIPLTVDRARYYEPQQAGVVPHKGWMIVSTDDANGKPQADLVLAGAVPPPAP